ncbi:MAG: hypothetical protein DRH21_00090 [Deltaproteobacteria bacterium]|nr:MAG: hypothetical protein DRH21_00090 [Deltaproteobacteria bacterium]
MNITNRIEVNTGLEDFVLLDRILETGAATIAGKKEYFNNPAYLGIESLAQLGAYHVRFINDFEIHAFLLKINRCRVIGNKILHGEYLIDGRLINQSKSSCSYFLKAKKEDQIQIEGEFLFSTLEYNNNFNKKILEKHYRRVFSCLKKE